MIPIAVALDGETSSLRAVYDDIDSIGAYRILCYQVIARG